MEFADRLLTCADCGNEFVFSAGEQAFFYEKQFKNDPKHCKQCSRNRGQRPQRPRVEVRVVCDGCGAPTTVPFMPRNGKPVFCHLCFRRSKEQPIAAVAEPVAAVSELMANVAEPVAC